MDYGLIIHIINCRLTKYIQKSQMSQSQTSPSSLKSFNVLQKLGEGSFASVYKVQRIDDKKLYAMKKVKISEMKQKQRDNALNEVRVLASISHPNIVNYKQAFFDDLTQSLCIVMELADAGDIQKKINQHIRNHTHFTEIQIWQALIQMSKGLKALHQINILHRDLKCANVFCTKDQKYKLGDLNVSKVAKRGMARTQTGTPYYTSPQVWKDRPYDSKCDIWSLGCVIYEMAALSPPFRANNLKQLYTKIQRGIFQRIPAFYTDDLADIVAECLKVNPVYRPSACQILEKQKVIYRMPENQKFGIEPAGGKKANLIGTILCPRDLKSLKMALPGAKYEQRDKQQKSRPKSVDGNRQNSQRSLSVRNNFQKPISNQIPRILNSPKIGDMPTKQIKYSLQRRPSSQRNILPLISKKQPYSQLRQREKQRQRQRQNSRQHSRNNSKLVRNNSVDSIRRKQDSNRSIQNKSFRRKDEKSQEKIDQGKAFMDDISNRCKNIKDRVEQLMVNRGIEQRYQKVSNSYQKKYNLAVPEPSSRQKRQSSIKSRNNSIEIKPSPNYQIPKQLSNRGMSERSLERNRSIEKIQRPNSRKIIVQPPRYMNYRR